VAQALRESQAIKVYICNVMTQPGESDHMAASDHVAAIIAHTGIRIFDYVLINNGIPSQEQLAKYQEVGQTLVEGDADKVRAMGFLPVTDNLMSESDFVRHDPMKMAQRVIGLLRRVG
jgi:uncharacterized cofD-like protein